MSPRFLPALCVTLLLCLSSPDSRAGSLSADLAITKTDGVVSATPGEQVVYTIVASNSGPSNAANTTVSDAFPASLSCTWACTASAGSSCSSNGAGDIDDVIMLAAGGSVTYTATCDIDPAASGVLSNTATVTEDASISDGNQANNSATDVDTLVASADLAISKASAVSAVAPGTQVTYSIVADNNGPSAVSDAVVTDDFPAALQNCSWTSTASGGATGNTSASGNLADTLDMPAGSSVSYEVTCDVDPAATGSLDNTATIASATAGDPASGNDSATESDALGALADLSISKTDNRTQHAPGSPVDYVVVVHNAGPSAVGDAVVTDDFQAPLLNCSWTSTASGGATGNTSASGDLNDTLDLPVGASVTYNVTCDVDASATGSLSNTATIDSATASDAVPGNNSATDADTVLLGAPGVVSVPALGPAAVWLMIGLLLVLGGGFLRRH